MLKTCRGVDGLDIYKLRRTNYEKQKMMALVTAAAMAFGLAGCGGGNTAATTAAPTEKAEGKLQQQKLLQKQQRLQSQKAVITGK